MKVNFTVVNGLSFEFDTNTSVETFEQLAEIQEMFGDPYCGCCDSEKPVRFVKRTNDGNDYFELQCTNCFAKLGIGQMKKEKGKLYPKRTWNSLSPSEQKQWPSKYEGKYLPNNGWHKWKELKEEKEKEGQEAKTKTKTRAKPAPASAPIPDEESIPF